MNILVTGASSGIGKEVAKQLAQEGHTVWALARDGEVLQKLSQEFGDGKIITHAVDVSKRENIAQSIASAQNKGIRFDAAICAAGIFPDDIHPNFSMEQFTCTIATNLLGVMNVVDALLPNFLAQGKGTFITIGSMAMYRGSARGAGYPASKAALVAAMKSLDLRYKKSNVRFHTAILGPIATSMWEGKISVLTPPPSAAARHIIAQLSTSSNISFFPKFTTTLYRLSLFVPDKLFVFLSEKLLK